MFILLYLFFYCLFYCLKPFYCSSCLLHCPIHLTPFGGPHFHLVFHCMKWWPGIRDGDLEVFLRCSSRTFMGSLRLPSFLAVGIAVVADPCPFLPVMLPSEMVCSLSLCFISAWHSLSPALSISAAFFHCFISQPTCLLHLTLPFGLKQRALLPLHFVLNLKHLSIIALSAGSHVLQFSLGPFCWSSRSTRSVSLTLLAGFEPQYLNILSFHFHL